MRRAAVAGWLALAGTVACGGLADPGVTHGPSPFIVTPTAMMLSPGQTQQVAVLANGRALTPTTLSVADSCVARVSASGLVTAIGPGWTQVRVELSAMGQTYSTTVPVTVGELAVLRLTIHSIWAGSPPQPVDLTAVRGTITVVANVDIATFGSAELRLAGRSVGSQVFPLESGVPSAPASVGFVVNTAARDSTGQPLYPNGPQTLEVRATRRPYAAGCPGGTGTIQQSLTLANP
jgi:hypothetical protein